MLSGSQFISSNYFFKRQFEKENQNELLFKNLEKGKKSSTLKANS